MTELLKQGLYNPMPVIDQVLSIYAGMRGHLDKGPLKEVHAWESGFLGFLREQKQTLYKKLEETKKLDDASFAEIDAAIGEFQKTFAVRKATVTA